MYETKKNAQKFVNVSFDLDSYAHWDSSPTPKIVYTFVVFSKLIADFVAKRNGWDTILESKHKHFERTKTNEFVVFLFHLDRMCFCFSEIMSIAFKWQDHFRSVSLKTFDLRTHHTSKQAIHVLCICMYALKYKTTNFTYALKYRMCIAVEVAELWFKSLRLIWVGSLTIWFMPLALLLIIYD